MKNFISKHISFISITILIAIWQVCGNLGLLPKFIFPTPLEIANAFVRDRALFLFHFKITMLEAIIGLSLGILIANHWNTPVSDIKDTIIIIPISKSNISNLLCIVSKISSSFTIPKKAIVNAPSIVA